MGISNPGAVIPRGGSGGSATPIVNDLITGGSNSALSAEQGRALGLAKLNRPTNAQSATAGQVPVLQVDGSLMYMALPTGSSSNASTGDVDGGTAAATGSGNIDGGNAQGI